MNYGVRAETNNKIHKTIMNVTINTRVWALGSHGLIFFKHRSLFTLSSFPTLSLTASPLSTFSISLIKPEQHGLQWAVGGKGEADAGCPLSTTDELAWGCEWVVTLSLLLDKQ